MGRVGAAHAVSPPSDHRPIPDIQRTLSLMKKLFAKVGQYLQAKRYFVLRRSYTKRLEGEMARLRAENRALVNSILGVAGMPPALDVRGWRLEAGRKTSADFSDRGQAWAWRRMRARRQGRQTPRNDVDGREDRKNAGRGFADPHGAAPCIEPPLHGVRRSARRSWRQISRAREIDDARAAQRERESDAKTFPAPRKIVPRV